MPVRLFSGRRTFPGRSEKLGKNHSGKHESAAEQFPPGKSLVQQQIDLGLVRPEDAERHPQRNVLLQCIGASEEVLPDFYRGTVFPGSLFLLCSDGFRHEISEQELYMQLQPSILTTEEMMKERLVYLTELVKSRMEMDNISAVVMKTVQEG